MLKALKGSTKTGGAGEVARILNAAQGKSAEQHSQRGELMRIALTKLCFVALHNGAVLVASDLLIKAMT